MANGNRPGRDIFSEEIIQEQIRRQPELGVKDINEIQNFQELVAPALGFTEEESRRSPDLGLHQEIFPEYFEEQPNFIIPTAQQMPPRGRGYSPGDRPWNPFETTAIKENVPILTAPRDKFGNLLPTRIPVGKAQQWEDKQFEQEEVPLWERFIKRIGFSGGGGIAGIQNLQTGGNPNTEDFTDVGFFGFEEQESVPSQAQQEEDRDLMQRAMDREEALANVARTDPYAPESRSSILAPKFPSGPLAPEPLLPVREQQRIHPFGLGDKAGIRFTDEETERIYDYINFQREYDPSGRRKYPEVELNAEFQLAKLKGTKPPKKSVVTTFRGVPQDDKANVPIIKSTSPTTGGLSELDKLTRSTLDDDALYAETLIPTDIPRGSFYDDPNYKKIEGERRKRQWENILKSQAERDALLAQQKYIESQADENYLNLIAQGPWSPASGPRYAPLSTAIGTDPTLGPTREDIFGVPRATDLITPSPLSTAIGTDPTLGPTIEDIYGVSRATDLTTPSPLSTIIGTDPTSGPTREDIYGVPRSAPVEPLIEGTANPYLEAASAWPPLSYGQSGFIPEELRGIRKRGGDESIIEALKGAGPGYNPGSWVTRGGPVGSVRELDELEGQIKDRYEESGIGPVWSGSGGLSNVGNLLGGLNFNDILKNLLISIGGGALGIPPVATAALNLVGSRLLPKYSFPTVSGEEEIIEPWEVIQAGGEEQRAQGGLISLAHGGNPSVYQAGENIEKLLATKMGYEGDKYSGVPNQEGMINTVNQNIGDNIKSGLRSIVANAYAQGNVPAPSVPQYNQAQLLNKGLTMLPNTANAPVPQQPQPQPVSNINTAYAQSTLPQSHYMQPNQVT